MGKIAFAVLAVPGVFLALNLFAQGRNDVEYGKYLVENVAMCVDCHTPRGANGQPDRSRWMKGTTLDFRPAETVPGWSNRAPDLTPAGPLWKKWGEAALVRFLQTGLGPGGQAAGPPMPPYRLKPADAQAVVAYLKTLR